MYTASTVLEDGTRIEIDHVPTGYTSYRFGRFETSCDIKEFTVMYDKDGKNHSNPEFKDFLVKSEYEVVAAIIDMINEIQDQKLKDSK